MRSLGEKGKKVGISSTLPPALRQLELEGKVERMPEEGLDMDRRAGPASVRDFAAWAALSQKGARSAVERAELAPIAVDGYAEDAFADEQALAVLR